MGESDVHSTKGFGASEPGPETRQAVLAKIDVSAPRHGLQQAHFSQHSVLSPFYSPAADQNALAALGAEGDSVSSLAETIWA